MNQRNARQPSAKTHAPSRMLLLFPFTQSSVAASLALSARLSLALPMTSPAIQSTTARTAIRKGERRVSMDVLSSSTERAELVRWPGRQNGTSSAATQPR